MVHGAAEVHELIEEAGWSYPVTKSRLERKYALENLDIDADGQSAMLGEILARVEDDRFESREDLEAKLQPVFELERKERKPGLLGRVKDIFLSR